MGCDPGSRSHQLCWLMESERIHVQTAMRVFACTRMCVSIWSGEELWGLALGYIKLGTHVWGRAAGRAG